MGNLRCDRHTIFVHTVIAICSVEPSGHKQPFPRLIPTTGYRTGSTAPAHRRCAPLGASRKDTLCLPIIRRPFKMGERRRAPIPRRFSKLRPPCSAWPRSKACHLFIDRKISGRKSDFFASHLAARAVRRHLPTSVACAALIFAMPGMAADGAASAVSATTAADAEVAEIW